MELKQIGVIHSSYQTRSEAPRQGRLSEEIQELEVYPEYMEGLLGIEDVSHLIVLYWFDRSDRNVLQGIPPKHGKVRGVFTSRSPNRPNPIAFSIAEIIEVHGNILKVKGLEALDKTPLLDLKIYSPEIDCVKEANAGWLNDENQPRH